jgi:Skp family chaperone for outer membrane proteins
MEKKRMSEQELVNKLQEQQEELENLNEELSALEKITKDATRIIKEQTERELPEEIEDTEALEHFLQGQYPYAYGQYKKDGKVVCPICKEEFKDFQAFVTHWETKHLDKYGAYKPSEQPQYAEKKSQEEIQKEQPKTEPKKEISPEEATRLWLESKKTRRKP